MYTCKFILYPQHAYLCTPMLMMITSPSRWKVEGEAGKNDERVKRDEETGDEEEDESEQQPRGITKNGEETREEGRVGNGRRIKERR